jgi:uncharacterized membrane protein
VATSALNPRQAVASGSIIDGIDAIIQVFEVAGVLALVVGALVAGLSYLTLLLKPAQRSLAYGRLRSGLGRAILVGLELLVAADIIRTVAIDQTLQSVAVLGIIVVIRTFLSWSLEVEIDGRWPWQRGSVASAPSPVGTVNSTGDEAVSPDA